MPTLSHSEHLVELLIQHFDFVLFFLLFRELFPWETLQIHQVLISHLLAFLLGHTDIDIFLYLSIGDSLIELLPSNFFMNRGRRSVFPPFKGYCVLLDFGLDFGREILSNIFFVVFNIPHSLSGHFLFQPFLFHFLVDDVVGGPPMNPTKFLVLLDDVEVLSLSFGFISYLVLFELFIVFFLMDWELLKVHGSFVELLSLFDKLLFHLFFLLLLLSIFFLLPEVELLLLFLFCMDLLIHLGDELIFHPFSFSFLISFFLEFSDFFLFLHHSLFDFFLLLLLVDGHNLASFPFLELSHNLDLPGPLFFFFLLFIEELLNFDLFFLIFPLEHGLLHIQIVVLIFEVVDADTQVRNILVDGFNLAFLVILLDAFDGLFRGFLVGFRGFLLRFFVDFIVVEFRLIGGFLLAGVGVFAAQLHAIHE